MKNFLLISFLAFPFINQAQTNCVGSFTEYYLNSNNIRASFFPRGNKFTNGDEGGFLAPYPSDKRLSTIFASAPWIGGFDDAGNFKFAGETFAVHGNTNFSVGPLTSIGLPYFQDCEMYDRAWSVFSEDILAHKEDWETDFQINDTIPSIFGWPALGNNYFESFNGFEIPLDNQGLADFFDRNGNNIYDPDQGEYPVVRLENGWPKIPDQMLWMVFNDVDTNNLSGNRPLRFEFQHTAFAFHCSNNELLNNTVFSKYKIINRSVTALDSAFFGFWTDYDLGCYLDDYIGCDSMRSTEFVYNADPVDGEPGNNCFSGIDAYSGIPPVQTMTYLSHPMAGFSSSGFEVGLPLEKYNLLNGQWGDGTPIRPEGDGHNEDPSLRPTKFLFHGDPRDTSSFAATNSFEPVFDYRTVSSVDLGRFDPGDVKVVLTAHMFHHDSLVDHFGQIALMYNNVDSLRAIYSSLNSSEHPCMPYPTCSGMACVWPGDFDKNGIVDHRDYLMWGVFNDQTGSVRDGQISWRGHQGDDWSNAFAGINAKHGDADGNGIVDLQDIEINRLNNKQTNQYFIGESFYPVGSDILLTAQPYLDEQGNVKEINVKTSRDIEKVHGLTFEIEFDTTLFEISNILPYGISDTLRLVYFEVYDPSNFYKFAFVKKDHSEIQVNSGTSFLLPISDDIKLKPGLPIPDCTTIRLRNLKAIDADGNDLQLGSMPLVVCKEGFVSVEDPETTITKVYPNPTKDELFIVSEIATEAQIFSIDGQLIRHLKEGDLSGSVDISALPPGLYVLRILATGESFKVVLQ
jgi:hypothetical protein